MTQKYIKGEDQLAMLENDLRTKGAWCRKIGSHEKIIHYYICKNPKANTAISLCATSLSSFDNLSKTAPERKCLVCDLFSSSRKEVKQRQYSIVSAKIPVPEINQPQSNQQEK